MSKDIEDVRKEIFEGMREQWDIPVIEETEVEYIDVVPSGWRSEVSLAFLKCRGVGSTQKVVIKTFKRLTVEQALKDEEKANRLFMYFKREASVWRKIGTHRNVSEVYGIMEQYRDSMLPAVVLPYYPNKDLRGMVETNANISLSTRLKLLRDVAKGLTYLHSLVPCVIHRDIRASNVLIKEEDSELVACISDFGSAKFLDVNGFDAAYTTTMSSPAWFPPEYIIDGKPCYKYATTYGDIWSFGCTLLETLTAANPWHEDENPLIRLSDNGHPCIPRHQMIPANVKSLIEKCWNMPPDSRMSARGIVQVLGMIIY